jgi:hypothetical protein
MDKSIKNQIKDLLVKRDYDRLIELCEKDRRFWQELRFRLYDIDERIRCSAIEAAGKFMQKLWEKGQREKVLVYIRTLFWSITDESGGIGWSAPQTIAQIISNIPELIDPYGSMMIAHTLEEPPLIKSGLWGIGLLGKKIADSVNFFKEIVLEVLKSDDAEVLGLAAWALGEVSFKPALPFLKQLTGRKDLVKIYIEGDFKEKLLGQWAQEAIDKIEKQEIENKSKCCINFMKIC